MVKTSNLFNKTLILGVIILFIGIVIIPSICGNNVKNNEYLVVTNVSKVTQNTNETHAIIASSLFGLQSVITVSWDANQTSEPLEPHGAYRTIDLDISYSVVKGFLGQFILWYYIFTRQIISVTVEIIEKPYYCTAIIDNSILFFSFSDIPSVKQSILGVSVNENAPAFEPFCVKIKASVNDIPGPFGFLTFINDFEIIQSIFFTTNYLSIMKVTPESNYIETTPGTTVVDPITVENLGNGKTLVDIQLNDFPEEWSLIIDPPQLIIEVDESKVTNLSITPPLDFYGHGTIVLIFTPKYYYNPEIEGLSEVIFIHVNVIP
jgi:hypothetical protein